MRDMEKKILVVDNFSFFSMFAVFLNFKSGGTVFYLHKGKGIFGKLPHGIIEKLGWSVRPIRSKLSPEGGISPFRRLSEVLIRQMELCRENIFLPRLKVLRGISEYERRRLATFLGKRASKELYFPMQILILLTTTLRMHERAAAIFLRKNAFSDIIQQIYRDAGLKIHFYPHLGPWKFEPRENYIWDKLIPKSRISLFKNLSKTALLVFYSLFCKCTCRFFRTKKNLKKYKICALVFNTHATELCNCMPWVLGDHDFLKKETIAFCHCSMPERAKRFYKEKADKFSEYNFNPFVGNKSAETIEAWALFANLFIKNARLYRQLFGSNAVNRWMAKNILDVLIYMSFFEALFGVIGTKILWTMNEDDSQMQMASMAVNRLGGIVCGTTWSLVPMPEWDIQHNMRDIYFMWGRRMARMRSDVQDQYNFSVITGYPADRAFKQQLREAEKLRFSILKENGKRRILTFFDNLCANDSEVSLDDFFAVYKEMFTWLAEDPSHFLIIKAKRPATIAGHYRLEEKINEFREKKQILVLYDKAVVYPGLAADLVIGAVSMTLTSLAAALGTPCIYYDIHDTMRDYPWMLPHVSVVSEEGAIKTAINDLMKHSIREGGYAKRLQPVTGSAIDPFLDGKSIYRMRSYLGNLLKKFAEGSSSFEAVDFSNSRHRAEWGENSVIPGSLLME